MGTTRDGFADDEWAQLSAADRALIEHIDGAEDEAEVDNRFGNLPYDDVFDPEGRLTT